MFIGFIVYFCVFLGIAQTDNVRAPGFKPLTSFFFSSRFPRCVSSSNGPLRLLAINLTVVLLHNIAERDSFARVRFIFLFARGLLR